MPEGTDSLDKFVDMLHSIFIVLSADLLAVDGQEFRLLACHDLQPTQLTHNSHDDIVTNGQTDKRTGYNT